MILTVSNIPLMMTNVMFVLTDISKIQLLPNASKVLTEFLTVANIPMGLFVLSVPEIFIYHRILVMLLELQFQIVRDTNKILFAKFVILDIT